MRTVVQWVSCRFVAVHYKFKRVQARQVHRLMGHIRRRSFISLQDTGGDIERARRAQLQVGDSTAFSPTEELCYSVAIVCAH